MMLLLGTFYNLPQLNLVRFFISKSDLDEEQDQQQNNNNTNPDTTQKLSSFITNLV